MPYRCVQDRAPGVVGGCLLAIVCAGVIAAASGAASASNTSKTLHDWEGRHANSILLNSEWQACADLLSDDYPAMISSGRTWQTVTVPARKWPTDALNEAAAVWVQRTVVIPNHLAGYEGVLRWGRVHWGAKSWVNGVAVGESPVTCPYEVALPAGLLHAGSNLVVLRVGGWSSVAKRNGVPLIPADFSDFGGPRPGAIFGDAWVDTKGMFLAAVGAGPVYELLGRKDMGTTEFPPIETALIDGDVAFRQHSGGHTPGPNWPTFLTFAQRYLHVD